MVDGCQHEIKIISLSWDRPHNSIYKLNTDGNALSNPGKIGGGGILRNDQGKMIHAFSIPLGTGTNNQADVQATFKGIHWCVQHGYRRIHLEIDSELLVKWLNASSKPPWKITHYIKELQTITSQLEFFQCNHTFRENNGTADLLSKWSHRFDTTQHFYTAISFRGW
ncbi:hypothetical protein MTR67_015998 [Solanum verrucosum]|uniref:RNase H type-1 domain-containing protein n=1 Tax=Solanum verrucosum TaxID=315347 RepID=A0AAF0TPU3_SOLVR|nr:hypothetical protein MTR67_015998 [Solanum verrucosum]